MFDMARAIQLCRCDLAGMVINSANFDRQSTKPFLNFAENRHFVSRKCFSRYSSRVAMTSSGFV